MSEINNNNEQVKLPVFTKINYGKRIVIDHDSSADNPATLTGYAELRSSFKVGAITHLGIGAVYVQQVNPSSPA